MNKLVVAILAVLAAVAGVLAFNQLNKPELPQYALYYSKARAIKPFSLTDQHGEPFGNAQLNQHWSWFFFGYTSCPDVCPTTLQELNFIYDDIKKVAPASRILFVSVDPKRDSQDKLAQYIHYFNDEFIALRGGHEVLFPFARNLGLMYAISDDAEGDDYLVQHSASIVLVNPDGNIAAMFKPEQAPGQVPSINGDKVLADYKRIVVLYQKS